MVDSAIRFQEKADLFEGLKLPKKPMN
jgi:hypothetical protein